jgi:hypothetical protein
VLMSVELGVFFGHFFHSFYFFSRGRAWVWDESGVYSTSSVVWVVGVGGMWGLYGWRANGLYACIHTYILR